MARKKSSGFHRTDLGNAKMLAHISSNDLRYDHKRGMWLLWAKHWWLEDKDGLVVRRATSVPEMRAQAAMQLDDSDNEGKKAELRWAHQSESRARLDAMIALARSEYPLFDPGEGWDADPMLLGVTNGVIDLRTGTLRDGRQEDKVTLHSDVVFDPEAKCPLFERFIEDISEGDRDVGEYVQRALGYCLTGDTREQCLFVCQGSGSNGKSTFLEVVRYVLGGYAYNLPFSAFELDRRSSIPNDIAQLPGKRFVTAIEMNEDARLNEGRIKLLTGCDPISARFLRREFFTFVPVAKYWLSFNNPPVVMDDSHGFWRRVRIIPFPRQFDGAAADDKLLEKLKTEAAGILAWAVRGCIAWQKNGLGMPPAVKAATEAYRQENDPLDEFFADCCILDPTACVGVSELREAYYGWASNNFERNVLDRRAFARRLRARGLRPDRLGKKRTRVWLGVRLTGCAEAQVPVQAVSG